MITDYKKEFLKIFNELCYSRQSWQVWADLMEAMACSLANSIIKVGPEYEAREKGYEEAIKRLGSVDKAAKCFATIVNALQENPEQDFLGSLYMELNLGNHWKGQFFTPYNITKMMAKITTAEAVEKVIEESWISIEDCAIGAGATLIAAANEFKYQGINYQQNVLFVGQDIDRITGMMAYIQLSLLGCAGYIVIADTLVNPIVGPRLFPTKQPGQEFWFMPRYYSAIWQGRQLANRLDRMLSRDPEQVTYRDNKFIFKFDERREINGRKKSC